ncbi:ATP-binding protein [Streptomyces buecherae]|uniref:ATP-binding protein n=1 Tax=Streptomyces buecherae TaxID=2763006 RepID=UPI0035583E09
MAFPAVPSPHDSIRTDAAPLASATPVAVYVCWPKHRNVDVERALTRVRRHLQTHAFRAVGLWVERADVSEYAQRPRWASVRCQVESGAARGIVSLWPVMLWWTPRQRDELVRWLAAHGAFVSTVEGGLPTMGRPRPASDRPLGRCTASVTLAPLRSSVPVARRFVTACLVSAGHREVIDAAALLTSELVANAVDHGANGGHATVGVHVWCEATRLHVEVRDPSDAPPRRRDVSELDEQGRGLTLVDALATRWGYDPTSPGPGKRVWFEVAYAA